MRKVLFISMAALVAACSTSVKQTAGDSISSVIANSADLVGKEIKVAAKLVEVNDSIHYEVVVGDSTQTIVARLADTTVSVCPSLVGKDVEVAGSVAQDEDGGYYIAATSITPVEGCNKSEGDSTKAEGECADKHAADVATDSSAAADVATDSSAAAE
jgi:hypothetical protein